MIGFAVAVAVVVVVVVVVVDDERTGEYCYSLGAAAVAVEWEVAL